MSNELTVQGFMQVLMPELKTNGIEAILPKHVSLETFTRLAAIAIVSNPMLTKADPQSVIQSLILSAKDGLVCDGREAALVPFNTKVNNQWVNKAQYMPMVDGVLKRVRQSGQVKIIASKPVFDNDEFSFWTDEEGDHFKHVPYMGKDSGELIAVIAYAVMNDGSKYVELLRRWEIDRVKDASKSGNKEGSPWLKWFDRMACKTGLHRVARRLPNSSEILEMLERGDMMDFKQEKDVTPKQQAKESKSMLDSIVDDAISNNETSISQPESVESQDQGQAQEEQSFYDYVIFQIEKCNTLDHWATINSDIKTHAEQHLDEIQLAEVNDWMTKKKAELVKK